MPATTAAASGGFETTSSGKEAIRKLKSTEPPLYLSPTPDLSESARLASEYLFSSLKPYTPKTPFSQLLVKGFDAEQIWQQIDIQSQPLISSLKRKVRNFEKNPDEIKKSFSVLEKGKPVEVEVKDLSVNGGIEEYEDEDEDETAFGDEEDDDEDDDDEEGADAEADADAEAVEVDVREEEEENEEEVEEGEEEEEEEEDDDDEDEEKESKRVKEDEFFKLDELEKYMEMDEAREYGYEIEKKKGKKRGHDEFAEEDEEEGGEDDDDEDEDGDELGLTGLDDDDDDDDHYGENARFEDFYVANNGKTTRKRKNKSIRESENLKMDEGLNDEDNDPMNAKPSTHELELEKQRAINEEMQKANLEPKSWTMQGEVTAAKRPKNSALGVDLDFDHNVPPARVITKEYDESLEDMITKRVSENGYNDNEKPPTLPSRAPREYKELDENKSKKGLAEHYEDEYAEKTGLVSVALSLSEQQKKEAKLLFQELCRKLDALSHFYLTPKPHIEDMSVQNNVPAFAIEEIAPVAVSDAAMLAPEEVFAGKGDIKDETELTQAERKRRRANKKRKFKANEAKKVVKAQPTPQEKEAEKDS